MSRRRYFSQLQKKRSPPDIDSTPTMDDADEISIEETNKLRAQLGLKPLTVPDPKTETDPKPSSAENEISIEETNRIRASLGLRPLTTEASTTSTSTQDQDEQAKQNWLEKKKRDDEEARKRREDEDEEKRKDLEMRNRRLEEAKVEGPASTAAFLRNLKKPKPKVSTMQVDEEDEDKTSYGSKDIAGLRVGHKLSDVQSLQSGTILTLKDQDFMNGDEEDVLESAELRDQERLQENIKNRSGKIDYDGYNDKSWLSRFDNEDKEEESSFILGTTIQGPGPGPGNAQSKSNHQDTSIDYEIDLDKAPKPKTSAKFKKPKKKSKAEQEPTRKRRIEDEEDLAPGIIIKNNHDADDDDDLQSRLSQNRRKVQKQRRNIDISEQVVSEKANSVDTTLSTNGFLASLSTSTSTKEKTPEAEDEESGRELAPQEQDQDQEMEVEVDKPEEKVSDEQRHNGGLLDALRHGDSSRVSSLEDGGLSSTLAILKQAGQMDKIDSETEAKRAKTRALDLKKQELQQWFNREAAKRREQTMSRTRHMSNRERQQYQEDENRRLRQEYHERLNKLYEGYEFQVDIRHVDDQGNELDSKQAYKHLSHQFHGVGPGKQKVEKDLKKRKEDKKRQAESIFDHGQSNTKGPVRLQ